MNIFKKAGYIGLKIWKDPVWSKVISAIIIAGTPILWARLTNHSWKEIYYFFLNVLSYKVPIYLFLSIVALYFIVHKFIQIFQNRINPFWDEKMGNYTFKDLYNILLTETLQVSTIAMGYSGKRPPHESMLYLFQEYYIFLVSGIDFESHINDENYLYSVLAPRLAGFGLVDAYDKPDQNLRRVTNKAYKISDMGNRFHAKLDKLKFDQKIKEMKKGGNLNKP